MRLENVTRIFVVILFLISPIENDNYIIVKYKNETTYDAGKFKNSFRNDVHHIIYEGKEVDLTKQFIIAANGIIEIHFNKSISSLEGFFGTQMDSNTKKYNFNTFSYFDSSSVENVQDLFYQCSLLEEINFNNFNTSKVTNMMALFYQCKKLKSLDLSNFVTSLVESMENMFYQCTSLEYLDISNFNT